MLPVSLDFPLLMVPSVFSKRLFVLCLVYSMLTMPLDYPFLIIPSVFSNVYLACVSCTQCWQCLWIVHSWLPPRFSLTFMCPLSCVLNVDSVSGLSILNNPLGFLLRLFILCLVYSMLTVPLDCPFLVAPRFSQTSTWPVSHVLNVDSVSGLSILDRPFGFL